MILPKPLREKRVSKPLRRVPLQRGKVDKPREPVKRKKPVKKVRTTERARLRRIEDAAWRLAVRLRAEGMCERTWGRGTDAHHIWPKGAHPKLRHVLDNGVLLTHAEHDEAHRGMSAFRGWFSVYFRERWARLEAARLG